MCVCERERDVRPRVLVCVCIDARAVVLGETSSTSFTKYRESFW